jgi:hypothetical protein
MNNNNKDRLFATIILVILLGGAFIALKYGKDEIKLQNYIMHR